MKEEFISGFKIITEETKITDLIPKGYTSINNQVNYEYNTEYNNSVLKIEIPIKKKTKTLKDYEDLVYCPWILHLKEQYPKQYYSIILEMISDDICEEGKNRSWVIEDEGSVIHWGISSICGTIPFDTKEHAEQGGEIIGDKLKLLI